MMRSIQRKTTPKVKQGKVQKKNNHARTPNYWNTPQRIPTIDKMKPGKGYRHFLGKRDIVTFIALLPKWDDLAIGLNAIVLTFGDPYTYGWYEYDTRGGVIGICAWPESEWMELEDKFYKADADFLERLGVDCHLKGSKWLCKFNPSQIKAYQLLNTFIHELGHHHDRMTTHNQKQAARGEPYAERYVAEFGEAIWKKYIGAFGLPESG